MLEVSHISKTFNAGTVNEKRALSDLSLRLADGEFATIVGSNGAGKSTLFNAIAGVFYVDAGTITLDGLPVGQWRPLTPEEIRELSDLSGQAQ